MIVADDQNQVHSIARRLLDPRRPHGTPSALEREEMLIPYDPVITLDPKRVLSHQYEVSVMIENLIGRIFALYGLSLTVHSLF